MATTVAVGPIRTDTTWTKAASPYAISGQLLVDEGATLTIEPGVEVRFGAAAQFWIRGALVAVGTATEPISLLGAEESAGFWTGIEVIGGAEPAVATIRHAVIAHAAGAGGRRAQVYAYLSALDLSDLEIRDGAGSGVIAESASLRMRRVSITRNATDAVLVSGLQTADPIYAPDIDALTLNGNGSDAVAVAGPGGFSADFTFRDLGVPYEIRSQITAAPEATITLAPGAELRFTPASELVVHGALEALGTADDPVTLRGVTSGPGAWHGIQVTGSSTGAATAHLQHVIVSDAGADGRAAVAVSDAVLVFIDGAVRDAAADGITIAGGVWGTNRIEGSSLTAIAGAGVANETTGIVLAPNDWWGSPSGPTTDAACGGTGTRVTGITRTAPWLTAADQQADPLAPVLAPVISLAPQRWYAPADGQTRVWVDLTLRDPYGHPLAGRVINLFSTAGTVTTGGVTDAAGHTLAYLTATTPGDAELTAALDGAARCEQADAGQALITFTDAQYVLVDGMQSPYMADGMEITPEPVTVGADTTLRATITNPNAEPIRVEAEFGIADYGIGLTFGPAGRPIVKEIPANGSAVFETTWQAPISGHYCLEVRYRVLAAGETGIESVLWAAAGAPTLPGRTGLFQGPGTGGSRKNLNAFGGPAGGWSPPKQNFNKSKGSDTGAGAGSGSEQVVGFLGWLGFTSSGDINKNMNGDPPRGDYTIVAEPVRRTFDHGARPNGWSDARFDADNALIDALAEYVAIGDAALFSLDRYGGATAAYDLQWASVQAASIVYYRKQLGTQAAVIADRLAALRAVIEREAPGEETTVEEARTRLTELRGNGFTEAELSAAGAFGLDDTRIKAILDDQLGRTPGMLAGRAVDQLAEAETVYRRLSDLWASIRTFPEESGPTASVVLAADATSDLARVGDATTSFKLANPLDVSATIQLKWRPVDLPPGWGVVVSPSEVRLEPGAQASVNVTISPSGPVAQGTIARVAVEGFASDQLLGGVVLAMLVPNYVPFSLTGAPAAGLPIELIAGIAVVAVVLLLVGLLLLRRRRRRSVARA